MDDFINTYDGGGLNGPPTAYFFIILGSKIQPIETTSDSKYYCVLLHAVTRNNELNWERAHSYLSCVLFGKFIEVIELVTCTLLPNVRFAGLSKGWIEWTKQPTKIGDTTEGLGKCKEAEPTPQCNFKCCTYSSDRILEGIAYRSKTICDGVGPSFYPWYGNTLGNKSH